MKNKKNINQNEISAALRKFLKNGGIIRQLPEEKFQGSQLVGEEKYQIYEPLSKLTALMSPNS